MSLAESRQNSRGCMATELLAAHMDCHMARLATHAVMTHKSGYRLVIADLVTGAVASQAVVLQRVTVQVETLSLDIDTAEAFAPAATLNRTLRLLYPTE